MKPTRGARFFMASVRALPLSLPLHMEFFILVALIGAFILVSAFFSAMETAFFSLQPVQIRRLKIKALAEAVERLLGNPRRLLSALAPTCR